jgi:pyruvate dehydrogenase E1 component alpha subunit
MTVAEMEKDQAECIVTPEGRLAPGQTHSTLADDELREIMRRMVFTRVWDERAVKLARQGRLGFYAPVAGQEASMIGSESALRRDDFILPSYRDIPQMVWHGYPLHQAFLYSRGHQLGGRIPDDVHVLSPQIIIGAQIVQAVGVAKAFALRAEERVAIAYIGDGGTSQGDFYEGLNFAGALNVPAIFFIQNNRFAISVPLHLQTRARTLADKAQAAGIPSVRVDGMDVLAVRLATERAAARARAGEGPTLIEAVTYRFGPHTMSGDDPTRYRTQEELERWQQLDPLVRFRKYLQGRRLWDDGLEQDAIAQAREAIAAALAQADAVAPMKVEDSIDSMFAQLPPNLVRQRAELRGQEVTV